MPYGRKVDQWSVCENICMCVCVCVRACVYVCTYVFIYVIICTICTPLSVSVFVIILINCSDLIDPPCNSGVTHQYIGQYTISTLLNVG